MNYTTHTVPFRWPLRVRFALWKRRVRRWWLRKRRPEVYAAVRDLERDITRQLIFGPPK